MRSGLIPRQIKENGITPQDFSAYPNYGGFAIEDAGGDFVYVGVPGLQPNSTADYSLQTGVGAARVTMPAPARAAAWAVIRAAPVIASPPRISTSPRLYL